MKLIIPTLAFLAGCADCVPFEEIEITGGTAAQRGEVAGAVDDVAAWTALDEVCVDRIALRDDLPDRGEAPLVLGRYKRSASLIEVLADQAFLRDTVIHELCHAIDLEEEVSERFGDVFAFDADAHGFDFGNDFDRQREAMALDCEVGPEALALGIEAAARCAPRIDTAPFEILLDRVYVGWDERLGLADLARDPLASVELGDEFVLPPFSPVVGTTAGELLIVSLDGEELVATAVDPNTGMVLGEPLGALLRPEVPLPEDVPHRLAGDGHAALADGSVVTTFSWLVASGRRLDFLALHDGEAWRLATEPCIARRSWVVQLLDGPLLVELVDDTLSWSRLTRRPIVARR